MRRSILGFFSHIHLRIMSLTQSHIQMNPSPRDTGRSVIMSSPFISKLGTNYCPRDEEVAEIQTLLAEPTLRLQHLDAEIADLQMALDKLIEQRVELSDYVDAHRDLISPARRLPLDIIQEIFIACLPTHRNCVMSAAEAPVLLGRICSSWRAITLSTPRLWASVHIVEPLPHHEGYSPAASTDKLEPRLETTRTWLGRSGQCPLSISLQFMAYPTDTPGPPNRFIQAVIPFASRWKHISFTMLPSVLEALSHLTAEDVPILKSVDITIHGSPWDSVRWDIFQFLRGAEIDSFSISSSILIFAPLELPLRWNRLTDISMMGTQGEMSLQILSRCPQLRSCRFRVRDGLDTNSAVEEPIIELPFLHTLDLECPTPSSTVTVRQLFARLSLPQLRNLRFRGLSDTIPPPPGALDNVNSDTVSDAPLLSAVAPRLESLDVNMGLFSKASFLGFLRELPPTVCELRISHFRRRYGIFDDQILESLIPSSDFSAFCCPGLQVLEINDRRCCSFSDETLLRFIKSRTRALKRVVIRFSRDMQLDIRPELQSFVQSGLHLDLRYPPPAVFQSSPWEGLPDAANFSQTLFAPATFNDDW
ncbi:hypothetical protein B0H17DRAFT_1011977 [Mycena rosella]|uniref:F-box domain-containing protein n=1 Tax=Mycena rosella TaxID=1033263 RepID=A0AAD7DEZ0_MYCRO|nr:hypothetical protein B0H17DRAFT_1011977 [Mycena rosella]